MIALALVTLLASDGVNAGAVVTPKATAPVAAKVRSILVMDLPPSAVTDPATLGTITNTLAVSVQKRPNLAVLTGEDVKRLAQVQADKQVLGCDNVSMSCISEIADAMGADLVLYGDVGKLSDLYVVNLNLFDVKQAKALGRQSVQVKTFDEAFIAQLDIAVRTLLSPVTGESSSVSLGGTSGASVPTIDLEALKQSGLKAINMKAERALETALDAQENASAPPEQKRDAWCGLARVEGANPYVEAATKACADWQQYVVANVDLEKNMTADYQTLSGFLELKRKSKEQKLEAIDAFLKSYARLSGRPMVKTVQGARERLVSTGAASLDDKDSDGITDDVDKCPNEPEDFDGYQDEDGCPDPDNDGDGVLDVNDKCPNEKGVSEKGGCPETIGDVATKAKNATGDFLDSAFDFIAFDTKSDPFIAFAGNIDSTFQPPGGDLSPGFGFRLAYTAFEGGIRVEFDTQKSDGDGFLLLGGYVGLQAFQIPKGDFALIRPSVGVDALLSPTDAGGYVVGPYLANTFRAAFFQLRVYYRYAFLTKGPLSLPQNMLGAELSVDIPTLFKD